jgi:hypothetical protein
MRRTITLAKYTGPSACTTTTTSTYQTKQQQKNTKMNACVKKGVAKQETSSKEPQIALLESQSLFAEGHNENIYGNWKP